jgi:hypothetical protein
MAEFNVHKWFKNQYLQENDDPKIGAELEAGLDGTGVAENESMSLPSPNFFYALHKVLKNFLDEKAVTSGDRMSYFSAEFPLSSYFEIWMRKQLGGSQLNEAPGSTLNLSQADMDKLHKGGKLEIDGHKLIFKVEESVNEGFTAGTGTVTINGKKNVYTSSYQGKTDNLEDFLKAIDRIPNTVKSVKVVDQEFKASDKEGIKSKVKELTTDDTDEFIISSFYGITKQDGDLDDPVYIDLKTPGSRQFGKDMAAGKYGSLD